MDEKYLRIRKSLELLQRRGASELVFGSESHSFVVNPCLLEHEVAAFERAHRITLPAEYREFLLNVGNGGAGPAYGFFRLGETDIGFEQGPWSENDGFIGILSEPFPHTSPWNDDSGRPDFDQAREGDSSDEERYEQQLSEWENRYFDSALVNGAIPICHLGCALRYWLIVTGAEKGNVWYDGRSSDEGLRPLTAKGRERLSFLDWYGLWLDEALESLD